MPWAPAFWTEGGAIARLLSPISPLVSAVTAHRMARPGWRAPVPVICIGNAGVGGAGKTTVALDLAARLKRRGLAIHFLTRGHGGQLAGPLLVDGARHTARQVGDEALLLAACAPCWIGVDRRESATQAVASGAQVLVMDDGLQNPTLAKTASLLVIDGAWGFGNGRVLPAGPLREPVREAARRCLAAVLIGVDSADAQACLPTDMPVLGARLMPGPELDSLRGLPVLAFAGIGRPQKFFDMLTQSGLQVERAVPFPDHHDFTASELVHPGQNRGQPGGAPGHHAQGPRAARSRLARPGSLRERSALLGGPGPAGGADRPDTGRVTAIDRLEAWALSASARLAGALPPRAASNLAGGLAGLIGPALPVSRVADANLRAALPALDAAARRHVVRRVWSELGRTAGELPHVAHLAQGSTSGPGWQVDGEGQAVLATLRARGGPVIFFSGHIGNWEVLPHAARAYGLPVASFYRAAGNGQVDALIGRLRQPAFGPAQKMFAKGVSGARQAMAHLRAGGHLAMLADQKLNDGVCARFFGLPAMTAPGPASFALHFGAPLVPVLARRVGPARLELVVEPPLVPAITGTRAGDVLALTQQVNDVLERWIRADPGSWLWLHRRWPKTHLPSAR